MDIKSKIILIAGPTASGKSKFAVQLAKRIDGEIINADSMQIYKEFKVLTARPSLKERKNIKHHLYGFLTVKKKFSTGQWLKLAKKKITEIRRRKKIPILVGGTGLYFKSLTDGLVKIPHIPIKFRNEIRLLQKKLGQKKFFKKLKKIDPFYASKIKQTDVQRSIRGYEVKFYTKKSLLEWFNETKPIFDNNIFLKLYINYPRKELIERISIRSKKMLREGAVKEVEKYLRIKIRQDFSSNKVIGVREITEYLNKTIGLETLKERISIKTRQYAKRQSTWARGKMLNWQNLEPVDLKNFLKKI